jgi:hypothetical protein
LGTNRPKTIVKMKNFILSLCLGLLLTPNLFAQTANFNPILQALKQANTQVLSNYWDTQVEITLGETDNFYSREQATKFITDFLNKNKPTACTLLHQGTARDNSSHYAIGTLVAGGSKYRMYILAKPAASPNVNNLPMQIQEMRLEKE